MVTWKNITRDSYTIISHFTNRLRVSFEDTFLNDIFMTFSQDISSISCSVCCSFGSDSILAWELPYAVSMAIKKKKEEGSEENCCSWPHRKRPYQVLFFFFISFSLFSFFLFRAIPGACGSSQTRGWIRATAADLLHSHSNTRSDPCLRPAP